MVKDNSVPRDDIYKSGTIHTGQGEPSSSRSRPTPKPKQVASKPITNGKLLRPGGPKGGPSKFTSRSAAVRPVPQPTPQARTPQAPLRSQPTTSQSRPIPQPATVNAKPIPQPLAAVNGVGHSRNLSSSSSNRAPPPPPPPAPTPAPTQASPPKDVHRALYDFKGKPGSTELSLTKDERLEVLQKEDNGIRLPSLMITKSYILIPCKDGGWPRES